jgi:molecular chaperone DnaJ
MTESDALRLLGLSPGATPSEVRAAFRRKVMERHPDTASDGSMGPDVQALVDAYRLLAGSETRSGYGTSPRFGEGASSGLRIEVDHRPEPRARSTGPTRPCQGCGGSGVRSRDSSCPACRGAGQITVLDVHRVRAGRCRSCQGRGRLRTLEICEVCGGAAT